MSVTWIQVSLPTCSLKKKKKKKGKKKGGEIILCPPMICLKKHFLYLWFKN